MSRFEPYYTKYMVREKTDRFGLSRLIQVLVIFAGVMLILSRLNSIELQSNQIRWDDQALTIHEPRGEIFSLAFSDVTSMELAEINDFGSWVRGMDTDNTRYGLWHNDRFGDYHLYVQKSIPCCVILHAGDEVTVLNLESEDVTRQLYEQFLEITGLSMNL